MNASKQEYLAERAAQMAALRPALTYEEIGRRFSIRRGTAWKTIKAHGLFSPLRKCTVCGIEFYHGKNREKNCSPQCCREHKRGIIMANNRSYNRKHPEMRRERKRLENQKASIVIEALRQAGCLDGVPATGTKQRSHIYQSARQLGLI